MPRGSMATGRRSPPSDRAASADLLGGGTAPPGGPSSDKGRGRGIPRHRGATPAGSEGRPGRALWTASAAFRRGTSSETTRRPGAGGAADGEDRKSVV